MYKEQEKGNSFYKEIVMFWVGMLVGLIVGGNLGVIIMALFKMNKN